MAEGGEGRQAAARLQVWRAEERSVADVRYALRLLFGAQVAVEEVPMALDEGGGAAKAPVEWRRLAASRS